MEIHIAGNEEGISVYRLKWARERGICQLWSYFKFSQKRANKVIIIKMKKNKQVKLFLDSGAFSAFTQGAKIDIQEYITFIKEHEGHLETYANLDVIGSAKKTYANQKIMEAAGLSPLPCFHYGEPLRYLENYVREYKYIALGGMVPISTKDLQKWLDGIWRQYLCDDKGMPKVKVHGFGLTSHKLMQRYPWYSVDSTSWVVTGRLGSVIVPKFKNGKWDHKTAPWKVAVSERSPSKKDANRHFSTFSEMEQEVILKYFKNKGYVIGKSSFKMEQEKYELDENERWNGKAINGKREVEIIKVPGLCNEYKMRDEINIIYYLDLEKTFPKWPYPFNMDTGKKGLF